MARAKKPPQEAPTDQRVNTLLLMEAMLTWMLHSSDRKPADNVAWESFGRVDAARRQLQRELGMEVTEMKDPLGRVSYDNAPKEGE